jgi:hypothetical protein
LVPRVCIFFIAIASGTLLSGGPVGDFRRSVQIETGAIHFLHRLNLSTTIFQL